MPRPLKIRRVESIPGITYFKPAGIPMKYLEENCLSVEEVEALRLKDIEKFDQVKCAEKMSISRATFQRILSSGRNKVTDALLNGKAIKIKGGNFELAFRTCQCRNGHEWDVSFEEMTGETPVICPKCQNGAIEPVQ